MTCDHSTKDRSLHSCWTRRKTAIGLDWSSPKTERQFLSVRTVLSSDWSTLSMEHPCKLSRVIGFCLLKCEQWLLDLYFVPGYLNSKGIAIEASFSPDSQFIFSGSTEGRVHVWNADTGFKVCVLNGDHPNPVQCVQFNPKYMMLVSACTNLGFWLPSIEEE